MQFKTTMKLNDRTTIEMQSEAKDLEEAAIQHASLLDFDGKCGLCGKDNITLRSNRSKDGKYTYTKYACNDCGAERPFGRRQDDKTMFMKQWQPKFEGNQQ
jgi:predicted RNA-binding Zn-ribbon protein involved in translation (DUF1610 family)